MIVITLTDCPISLRGDLTKWLLEINTGVFVGRVSARVRDNLWKRVVQNVKNGRATLVFNTNNEQHMDFRIHQSENEIIDFDGLKLVMKPSFARTKILTKKRLGFSKAGRMLMARKIQSSAITKANIQKMTYPRDYVVLDLETSGLDAEKNEIIEIAILKIEHDKVIDNFQVLVKPKHLVSSFIEQLTGITNETLKKGGRGIGEVLPDVRNFIDKNIIIGHNVNFDINFLNQAYSQHDFGEIHNNYFDTMKMYEKFLNGRRASKRLIEVAKVFEIPVARNHRGLADCYTIKAVFEALREKLDK